jgi:ABC-2 type transport system ATP-binding protein
MDAPPIEITGLRKHYGKVKAVDGIDLTVAPGEIYGLLGPNGAGKTTTIRTLLGYLNATEGTTSVLGRSASEPHVRRSIGYLPGDLRLEPKSKVSALLDFYADLRGGVDRDYIRTLCARLSLDSSRRFGELSKGNRQKVGVVQAVMHRPEVLVLDEPTSGLDPLMQREVMRLVAERRDDGAAVLFSSHIIFEVEEAADRVGIMRAGKLVVQDTVEGLQRITARQSMHVRFERDVSAADFDGVAGLISVAADDRTADIVIKGHAAPLLARLAELEAAHISTDPLVLDDIFYGVYDASASSQSGAGESGR